MSKQKYIIENEFDEYEFYFCGRLKSADHIHHIAGRGKGKDEKWNWIALTHNNHLYGVHQRYKDDTKLYKMTKNEKIQRFLAIKIHKKEITKDKILKLGYDIEEINKYKREIKDNKVREEYMALL